MMDTQNKRSVAERTSIAKSGRSLGNTDSLAIPNKRLQRLDFRGFVIGEAQTFFVCKELAATLNVEEIADHGLTAKPGSAFR